MTTDRTGRFRHLLGKPLNDEPPGARSTRRAGPRHHPTDYPPERSGRNYPARRSPDPTAHPVIGAIRAWIHSGRTNLRSMGRIPTKSLLAGGLIAVGAVAAWKVLSGRHDRLEAGDDILSTANPLLAGPLYADPGQRPLVDEPPDDPMNDALPLGLA